MFRRIIVPIDGSEISKKAAKKGLELAQSSDIKVVAMHVIPDLPSLRGHHRGASIMKKCANLSERKDNRISMR